jgi:hypothetical protein
MRRLALFMIAAISPCFAAPAFDVLLPPNASVVFGLRTTTLLNLLAQQEGAKDLRQQAALLLAATPFAGFDPFTDLDEIVLTATSTGSNPPALIILTGRFNAAKLTNGKGRPYRNATLIQSGASKTVLAVLDQKTLLAGDLALVKGAIERASSKPAAGPLAARLETMRSRYDIWAFADRIQNPQLPDAVMPSFAKSLRSLDRFWAGAAFAKNFELAAEIHLRSADDAQAIAALVREFETEIKGQLNGAANLELATTADTISLSMSIPEQEWKKALETRLKPTPKTAQPVQSTGLHITGGEPPAEPKPQVITTDTRGNTVTLSLPGK